MKLLVSWCPSSVCIAGRHWSWEAASRRKGSWTLTSEIWGWGRGCTAENKGGRKEQERGGGKIKEAEGGWAWGEGTKLHSTSQIQVPALTSQAACASCGCKLPWLKKTALGFAWNADLHEILIYTCQCSICISTSFHMTNSRASYSHIETSHSLDFDRL